MKPLFFANYPLQLQAISGNNLIEKDYLPCLINRRNINTTPLLQKLLASRSTRMALPIAVSKHLI